METSIIAAIMSGLLVLGAVFCYLMASPPDGTLSLGLNIGNSVKRGI